jgi:hypothetical protein
MKHNYKSNTKTVLIAAPDCPNKQHHSTSSEADNINGKTAATQLGTSSTGSSTPA